MRSHVHAEYRYCINSPPARAQVDSRIVLLWIDSDHRYEAVRRDLESSLPDIVSDGVLAFREANNEPVARPL